MSSASLSSTKSASTLYSTSLGSTSDESHKDGDSDGSFKCTDPDYGGEIDSEQEDSTRRGQEIDERGCIYGRSEVVEGLRADEVQEEGQTSEKNVHTTPTRRKIGGDLGSTGVQSRAIGDVVGLGDGYAADRLFDRVNAIHWVDGGNGDLAGSFPSDPACLAALASRRSLAVRVHGTAYQWRDPCRPHMAIERDMFLSSLATFRSAFDEREGRTSDDSIGGGLWGRNAGCARSRAHEEVTVDAAVDTATCRLAEGASGCAGVGVRAEYYFENEEPSLDVHFQVLRDFSPL